MFNTITKRHLQLNGCANWKQRFDDSSMQWGRGVVGGDAKPNITQEKWHPTLKDKNIFLHCQSNIITPNKTKNYSWISSYTWSIFNSQVYPNCALLSLDTFSAMFWLTGLPLVRISHIGGQSSAPLGPCIKGLF